MLTGWEFFKIHKSLYFHFHTEQYDVLKYMGKINVSPEKFGMRSDRYRFDYYGNKFNKKHKAAQFCIANYVEGNKDFIYESFEDSEIIYNRWRKRQESITKLFSDDTEKILIKITDGVNMYNVTPKGNLPPLLQMFKVGYISIETLVILNKEHNKFIDDWMKLTPNDAYLKNLILRLKKYSPFVQYKQSKILPIIKEQLK